MQFLRSTVPISAEAPFTREERASNASEVDADTVKRLDRPSDDGTWEKQIKGAAMRRFG
jgi:hypothetical protein